MSIKAPDASTKKTTRRGCRSTLWTSSARCWPSCKRSDLPKRPVWKAHRLGGDRKGTWSLHVTRNWRLTFRIDDGEIADVDFEDYH